MASDDRRQEASLNSITDISSFEKAIKDGFLGENLAKRAQKAKHLQTKEVKVPGMDYRIFTFSDSTAGYTAMIEKDKLVLLCKGVGGGFAENFKISNKSGHKILYFEYTVGSGVDRKKRGEYNLGSGKSLVSDNN